MTEQQAMQSAVDNSLLPLELKAIRQYEKRLIARLKSARREKKLLKDRIKMLVKARNRE